MYFKTLLFLSFLCSSVYASDFTEYIKDQLENGAHTFSDVDRFSDLGTRRSLDYVQDGNVIRVEFSHYFFGSTGLRLFDQSTQVAKISESQIVPGSIRYYLTEPISWHTDCNGLTSLYLYAYDSEGRFLGEGFCTYLKGDDQAFLTQVDGSATLINIKTYDYKRSFGRYFPAIAVSELFLALKCPTYACLAEETDVSHVFYFAGAERKFWEPVLKSLKSSGLIYNHDKPDSAYTMNLRSNTTRSLSKGKGAVRLLLSPKTMDTYRVVASSLEITDWTKAYFAAGRGAYRAEQKIPVSEIQAIEVYPAAERKAVISYLKEINFPLPKGRTYEDFVILSSEVR